ncbi:acyl-CoA thioesterase [Thalassoglobus sp.]|uniref:acyl-CoA thioesterase n=1 Tax=Thalassoglobus sp. TaxID=2795869 RepID=UPI003AA835B2
MAKFVTQRRVEFANTDMAGIVHYVSFYRWFEEAEHEYFRSLGLNIMEKQEDGSYIGWPRVSASCHFEAPAYHEDILDIHLQVERIGLKSLTFFAEFFCRGKRLAYGRMKTACCICGLESGLESIPIPQRYLDLIEETKREK